MSAHAISPNASMAPQDVLVAVAGDSAAALWLLAEMQPAAQGSGLQTLDSILLPPPAASPTPADANGRAHAASAPGDASSRACARELAQEAGGVKAPAGSPAPNCKEAEDAVRRGLVSEERRLRWKQGEIEGECNESSAKRVPDIRERGQWRGRGAELGHERGAPGTERLLDSRKWRPQRERSAESGSGSDTYNTERREAARLTRRWRAAARRAAIAYAGGI